MMREIERDLLIVAFPTHLQPAYMPWSGVSNLPSFGVHDDVPTNWATRPGHKWNFLLNCKKVWIIKVILYLENLNKSQWISGLTSLLHQSYRASFASLIWFKAYDVSLICFICVYFCFYSFATVSSATIICFLWAFTL